MSPIQELRIVLDEYNSIGGSGTPLYSLLRDVLAHVDGMEKEITFLRAGLRAMIDSDEEVEKARAAARLGGLIQ